MDEIADGVWQLSLLPGDGINAYLIGDVLVDTGIEQSAAKITTMLDGRSISAIGIPIPTAGLRQPPDLFTPDPAKKRESERKLSALEPGTVGFGHGPVLKEGAAGKLSTFVRQLPTAKSGALAITGRVRVVASRPPRAGDLRTERGVGWSLLAMTGRKVTNSAARSVVRRDLG